MGLDPQAQMIVDGMNAGGVKLFGADDVVAGREAIEANMGMAGPGEDVEHVDDRTIPGPDGDIRVRVYRPKSDGPLPVLVYYHGGGWVICSIDTHDSLCRELTNRTGCIVVSVDYRLAPEHKFPAAAEDAYAAYIWVATHGSEIGGDIERIAIGGDSAGGNLTAVVALMARDRGAPSPVFQLLVYPVTDHDFELPSMIENAEGYLLGRADMQWFWGHYLSDPSEADNPYAAPLRAESVAGTPPALVITAEYDPLRDEGEAYGARLIEAGVPTTVTRYDGMFHGFFQMGAMLDRGRDAVAEAASALQQAFAR